MKQETLIAYSMSAAAYLVENIPGISNIILFGSVARGKYDGKSDIDIFVDIRLFSKKKEREIIQALDRFKETELFGKWRLKGVKAEIVPVIGNLKADEWKSLYLSICSEGIALYGKYQSVPQGLKHHMIFSYGPVKDGGERVNIYRKLFGYTSGKKHYPGAVSKFNGKKLGPSVFVVPIEDAKTIRGFLEKAKISPRMLEVWL